MSTWPEIVKCSKCGLEYSCANAVCPQCGTKRIKNKRLKLFSKVLLMIFLLASTIIFGYQYYYHLTNPLYKCGVLWIVSSGSLVGFLFGSYIKNSFMKLMSKPNFSAYKNIFGVAILPFMLCLASTELATPNIAKEIIYWLLWVLIGVYAAFEWNQ